MASKHFERRAYPAGASLSSLPAKDGWPLRRFDWEAEGASRGSILFQGGRGDILEKYLEAFGHWHDRGWNITAFDWRGQGGSGRLSQDAHLGHCPDFGIWINDLADFAESWQAQAPGPHIIMGHSMGGHLVLRALAERRIHHDAAVLVAPMLGFETRPLPLKWAAWLVRQLAKVWPERSAWKTNERPAPPWASRQRFLTHDLERYSDEIWWKQEKPELALGPPSLGWLAEAYGSVLMLEAPGAVEHITIPVLMVGSEGDQLVSPAAMLKFAARLPNCQLKMFDKSVAHEILREQDGPREEALALIDTHLAKVSAT